MAAFKFPESEPNSMEAMQKIVEAANLPVLLSVCYELKLRFSGFYYLE